MMWEMQCFVFSFYEDGAFYRFILTMSIFLIGDLFTNRSTDDIFSFVVISMEILLLLNRKLVIIVVQIYC